MAEGFEVEVNQVITNLVQSNVEKLVNGLQKFGTDKYKKIKVKTGIAFENYLNSAAQKYGYSKTILYRDKQVPLYEFYVEMDLKSGNEIISAENVEDIIEKDNFVTVYGSGGLGKSTLFKHFFMSALMKSDLIPIFVELKIVNDDDISLIDCIYKSLNNLKFDLEKEYFEFSLNNGKYLILLDGFDEVMDSKREKLISEIVSLSDKYNENKYLLSSRRNDTLFNGWNKSTNFDLLPLDRDKSIVLIEKLNYNPEIKEKFLNELKKDLFEKHQSFCSNPLLLNLMLLTYEEFAEIPEKVHIFYENAFSVLYSKHDATKAFKRKHKTSNDLGYDDFIKVLYAMSALSYIDSTLSFDYPTLVKYVDNSKKITNIKDFQTEEFITDIVESICLMYLEGLKYNFQHRSFQEFFTAKFILNLPDKNQLGIISKFIERKYNSLKTDNVLNLLMEMEKQKIEKVFLIPKLKEIRDFVDDENEEKKYFNYLSTAFKSYEIDPELLVREPEFNHLWECISFTFISKRKLHYLETISYIYDKYSKNSNFEKSSLPTTKYKRLDIIKKYGTDEFGTGRITVDISKIQPGTELMEDFLKHSNHSIERFNFCMDLLAILEEQHRENENMFGELFDLN